MARIRIEDLSRRTLLEEEYRWIDDIMPDTERDNDSPSIDVEGDVEGVARRVIPNFNPFVANAVAGVRG